MSRDAEKQADPFAEATPRPWRLSPNGLAVYAQSDPVPAARCYGDSEAEVHANAALIVTAVNERDSLKREVEELREALQRTTDAYDAVAPLMANDDNAEALSALAYAIDAAEAALSRGAK
jgi:hypothetical protein